MAGEAAKNKAKANSAFEEMVPLCRLVLNSLVLPQVYTSDIATDGAAQNQLALETLYGEQWLLVLLVSFLITWGVGLTPPLLIRFVIVCRPVGKAPAIGIAFAFLVFNLIVFMALGSQSKSHTALALVALVSYWILRKQPSQQRRQGLAR